MIWQCSWQLAILFFSSHGHDALPECAEELEDCEEDPEVLQLLQTELRVLDGPAAGRAHTRSPMQDLVAWLDLTDDAKDLRFSEPPSPHAAQAKSAQEKVSIQSALFTLGCLMTFLPPLLGISLTLLGVSIRKKSGLYHGLKAWIQNANFLSNAELSLRGGFFAVLAALPFVVPSLNYLWQGKFFDYSVLTMYIFTLFKSVGETIHNAFASMLGTMLAVANIWVLYGFFPADSQDGGSVRLYVAAIDGVCFAVAIIMLQVPNTLRMFALSSHAYFMMSFFDPKGGKGFIADSGFKVSMEGEAVHTLVLSGIGAGCAVLATLLPSPIFALDKARDTAEGLSRTILTSWEEAVTLYLADNYSSRLNDCLKRDVQKLRLDLLALDQHLTNSWWECLGIGRPQQVRNILQQLAHALRELYNRLSTALCAAEDQEYSKARRELMQHMAPHLRSLVLEASCLLDTVVDAAMDGVLDADEAALVKTQQERTLAAIASLTKAFGEHVSHYEEELSDEYGFCLACCAYGRIAVNFSKTFDEIPELDLPTPAFLLDLAQMHGKVHWNFVLRHSVAIGLSFLIGYYGVGASVLTPYSAGCAVTVALLMNTGLGTSMRKNLGRLQGVVLGQVFGQIAYVLFAWCSVAGHVKVGASLFLWEALALYTYYSSVEFGYTACLMAAFAPKNLLHGCTDDPADLNAANTYGSIVASAIGISIMSAVDLCLARQRVSDAACERLDLAWSAYREALVKLFDPSVTHIRFHHGELLRLFAEVAEMGDSADNEPRLWRTPWKRSLFEAVVKAGNELLQNLCSMESAFAINGCDGSPKSEVLQWLCKMPAFQKVKDDILEYVDQFYCLFGIFKHTTEDGFFDKALADEGSDSKLQNIKQDITRLCLELEAQHVTDMGKEEMNSLERRAVCQIGVFLTCLQTQLSVLCSLKNEMLTS
mmetsp:Transcript_60974/g.108362  ORF Transcript_60974/g.108362 Transcript_60974/m.108362 type:complete len:934 (+) Transcript_60974:68-2869(+)